MTAFTHNDINSGMIVRLTGCNGTWTVVGLKDGWRGVKVQPENLDEDAIWIDIEEVTDIVAGDMLTPTHSLVQVCSK